MKRMLMGISIIAASAAFAAPANAADLSADTAWAPCGSTPLVQCITSQLEVNADLAVCNGDPIDVCAERLARWVADQVDPQTLITTVFDQVDYVGYLANWAIETAERVCGQVISTCDDGDLPLLP